MYNHNQTYKFGDVGHYEKELLHTITCKRFAFDYASKIIDLFPDGKFWTDSRHKHIYEVIKKVVSDDKHPDIIAVFLYAEKMKYQEKVGDAQYLASIWTEASFGDVELLTGYLADLARERIKEEINATKNK